MAWFSKKYQYVSEKNGLIDVEKRFNTWSVRVKNCGQTTPYVSSVWARVFRKAKKQLAGNPVHNILALGLGAGGEIKTMYKQFPNSSITAVEYDPEMIRLFKSLRLYSPFPEPTVIQEDAARAVADITVPADLIVVDLFNGPSPSPLLADSIFKKHMLRILSKSGALLVNVYREREYLDGLAPLFEYADIHEYSYNYVGLFMNAK